MFYFFNYEQNIIKNYLRYILIIIFINFLHQRLLFWYDWVVDVTCNVIYDV